MSRLKAFVHRHGHDDHGSQQRESVDVTGLKLQLNNLDDDIPRFTSGLGAINPLPNAGNATHIDQTYVASDQGLFGTDASTIDRMSDIDDDGAQDLDPDPSNRHHEQSLGKGRTIGNDAHVRQDARLSLNPPFPENMATKLTVPRFPQQQGDSYPSTSSAGSSERSNDRLRVIERPQQVEEEPTFSYVPRLCGKNTQTKSLVIPQPQEMSTQSHVAPASRASISKTAVHGIDPNHTPNQNTHPSTQSAAQHVLEPTNLKAPKQNHHKHSQPAEAPRQSIAPTEPNPTKRPHGLDFEPATLAKMAFAELRGKPFDEDPNVTHPPLAPRIARLVLREQLSEVLHFDLEEQDAYFATLNREQWDEAGDWFLEQFGGILSKLKDVRGEKRAVAKAFEDEIEKRHESVAAEQQKIHDELAGMRERGPLVLQPTPRKGN